MATIPELPLITSVKGIGRIPRSAMAEDKPRYRAATIGNFALSHRRRNTSPLQQLRQVRVSTTKARGPAPSPPLLDYPTDEETPTMEEIMTESLQKHLDDISIIKRDLAHIKQEYVKTPIFRYLFRAIDFPESIKTRIKRVRCSSSTLLRSRVVSRKPSPRHESNMALKDEKRLFFESRPVLSPKPKAKSGARTLMASADYSTNIDMKKLTRNGR